MRSQRLDIVEQDLRLVVPEGEVVCGRGGLFPYNGAVEGSDRVSCESSCTFARTLLRSFGLSKSSNMYIQSSAGTSLIEERLSDMTTAGLGGCLGAAVAGVHATWAMSRASERRARWQRRRSGDGWKRRKGQSKSTSSSGSIAHSLLHLGNARQVIILALNSSARLCIATTMGRRRGQALLHHPTPRRPSRERAQRGANDSDFKIPAIPAAWPAAPTAAHQGANFASRFSQAKLADHMERGTARARTKKSTTNW